MIIIFILLSFLLYGPTLQNGFVMDDYPMLIENSGMHDLGNMAENILRPVNDQDPYKYGRPVSIIFRMFLYQMFGADPSGYHVVNILLFALCGFLLFRFLHLITGNKNVALLASVMFTCHPINHIPVNFISGHEILLFGIFDLLMVIYFYHFLEKKNHRNLYFSVLFYILALLTQEVNVFAAAVPVLMAFVLKKETLERSFAYCKWHLSAAFVFIALKFLAGPALNAFGGDISSLPQLYGWYISKLFNPAGIVFMWNASGNEGRMWEYYAICLFSVLIFLVLVNQKNNVLTFGLLWFLVGLVPVSALCFVYSSAMGLIIEPHWLFFASGGFFLGAAVLLDRMPPKFRISLLAVIFVFWITKIDLYNHVWKSNTRYSLYWLEKVPHNPYALLTLARQYQRKNDPQKAKKYFELVLTKYGSHYSIYQGLSDAYEKMGEFSKAQAALQKAVELYPDSAELYDQWGVLYFAEGKTAQAREKFQTALTFDRDHCSALRNFADMSILLDDIENAASSLEQYYQSRCPSEKEEALAKLVVCYYKQHQEQKFNAAFSEYQKNFSARLKSLAKLAVDMKAPQLAQEILKREAIDTGRHAR